MKDLLKFQPPKTARLNAAEYTNFIERFLSLTTAAGAGVVHYQQADVDRMTQLHGLLLDNVRRNMAAAETATLQELETLRDEKGQLILNGVKAGQSMVLPAIAEASKALWFVLSPYEGFHRLPNMQETATIEGMLLDLSKGDCPTHLATLGLTESVAELADANSRYKALTAQRTTSVSDAKTPDSKSLRAELDALYAEIIQTVNAYAIVQPTEAIESFIAQMNALISLTRPGTSSGSGSADSGTSDSGTSDGEDNGSADSGGDTNPEPTPDPDPDTGGGGDDNPYEDEDGGLAG